MHLIVIGFVSGEPHVQCFEFPKKMGLISNFYTKYCGKTLIKVMFSLSK